MDSLAHSKPSARSMACTSQCKHARVREDVVSGAQSHERGSICKEVSSVGPLCIRGALISRGNGDLPV